MAVNGTNGGNDAPFLIPNIKNRSEFFTRFNMIMPYELKNIENLTQLGYNTTALFISKFGKNWDIFLVEIVSNNIWIKILPCTYI